MLDREINSLLIKLEHASTFELSNIVHELIERSAPADLVAAIVEKRLAGGDHVRTQVLARLLIQGKSKTLYQKAVAQGIKSDSWAVLDLYTGRFPDPDIELLLTKKLYAVAFNDGDPLRRAIVTAMRDVGSPSVLPTLMAIAHDLEPSAKVGKNFGSSLGVVESLSGQARYDFLQNVLVAIDEIEKRQERNAIAITTNSDQTRFAEETAANARRFQQEAENYLGISPTIVVFYVRKGAEALAKDIYRHLGLEKTARPARKMMLEELISQLKQVKKNSPPDLLHAFLQTFQAFGNFVSHDQDGEDVQLTNEIAEPLYKLYCEALNFYTKWRRDSPDNHNFPE